MKRSILATLLTAVAALTVGALAHAATDEERAAARAKWESMTPEQKAAAKEKAKAKWDAMSPEEKDAAKKRFAERHPRAAAKLAEKHRDAAASAPGQ